MDIGEHERNTYVYQVQVNLMILAIGPYICIREHTLKRQNRYAHQIILTKIKHMNHKLSLEDSLTKSQKYRSRQGDRVFSQWHSIRVQGGHSSHSVSHESHLWLEILRPSSSQLLKKNVDFTLKCYNESLSYNYEKVGHNTFIQDRFAKSTLFQSIFIKQLLFYAYLSIYILNLPRNRHLRQKVSISQPMCSQFGLITLVMCLIMTFSKSTIC